MAVDWVSKLPKGFVFPAVWLLMTFFAFIFIGIGLWGMGIGVTIFLVLIVPGIALGRIFVAIMAVGHAWQVRRDWKAVCATITYPLIALGLAAALTLPTVRWTGTGTDWAWFLLKRSHLKKVVALAKAGNFDRTDRVFQEHEGMTFMLDSGPPLRVAFKLPGGLLSNWSSVVYDPTGEVLLAKGFDENSDDFTAPERVTRLFRGDLLFCSPMRGDFYRCQFT